MIDLQNQVDELKDEGNDYIQFTDFLRLSLILLFTYEKEIKKS